MLQQVRDAAQVSALWVVALLFGALAFLVACYAVRVARTTAADLRLENDKLWRALRSKATAEATTEPRPVAMAQPVEAPRVTMPMVPRPPRLPQVFAHVPALAQDDDEPPSRGRTKLHAAPPPGPGGIGPRGLS